MVVALSYTVDMVTHSLLQSVKEPYGCCSRPYSTDTVNSESTLNREPAMPGASTPGAPAEDAGQHGDAFWSAAMPDLPTLFALSVRP